MEATRSRRATPVAVATLALAGSAALAFGAGDMIGFIDAGAEALFVATWILGWTLLAWATILGGLGVIQLVCRLVSRRSAGWSDILVLVAGVAVVVAVTCSHPLGGTGSGVG